ncbi:MAG TPA: HAMP domain-containing sensor histidine kinase [Thermoanaerobaculia bacterium]
MTDFPIIGALVTNHRAFVPQTPVPTVAAEFSRDPQLEAVAIVDGAKPAGLVTRGKFLSTVYRQFGWEIYQRKTIAAVAEKAPLVLPDWSRLDAALNLALQRQSQDLYDEVVVIRDDGSFAGLLSVRQMVLQQSQALATAIVQKELATVRAQELEEVGRIKSQFLANVTHELRSPVNAIIELAELLRMKPDEHRLSLLTSCATNLRSVINNMLELSKIEAGKMRVVNDQFDLVPLLHEVAETARVLAGRKPVEVLVSTGGRTVPVVSDEVKVRQIVLNLASNAVKFTDAGRIVLQQTSIEDTVAIAVIDTGIGIRPDDLAKLFLPFSQLEDAHTKTREGTGLGLAIVRELAQLLGGRVAVESRHGHGSRFTLHLPKEIPQ